jgi:hypothetical protein
VENFDLEILTEELVEQLRPLLPNAYELDCLRGAPALRELWCGPEKLMADLAEVQELPQLLEHLAFKHRFESQVGNLRPDMEALNKAIQESLSSQKLRHVMHICLLLGNFINSNSPRGSQQSFRLISLLRLQECSSRLVGHSLLHYLVDSLSARYPQLLTFPEELPNVDYAAKVSLKAAQQVMDELMQGFGALETFLANGRVGPSARKVLQSFLSQCKPGCEIIAALLKRVEKSFQSLLEMFGERPDSLGTEAFFGQISRFMEQFEEARVLQRQKKLQGMTKLLARLASGEANRSRRLTRSLTDSQ